MNYQLPFKQEGIIAELGGGDCPRFRPNIDIRALPTVDIVADFNKSLPIPDNSYDGIFSNYNLEHISWRSVKPLLTEVYRILKPNGIAVFITANLLEQCKAIANKNKLDESLICMIFGGQKFGEEPGFDENWEANAHHNGFSPEYITQILAEIGFTNTKIFPIQTFVGLTDMIIETAKPDTIKDAIITSECPNMKLNIGSFTVMNRNNWTNIDILNLNSYAQENNFIFRQHDCTRSIPYNDNSIDMIVASHFIEHITREQGKQFVKEVYRVLKPNGIIRFTVPDAKIIVQDFLSGTISRHASHNEGVKNSPDDAQSLFELLISGHLTIYDETSLSKLLIETGFAEIQKMEYQKSKSSIIEKENKDTYPELSLYIEAIKPDTSGRSTQPQLIITQGTDLCHKQEQNEQNEHNEQKLRIALISTPFFTVPPQGYSGLEQIVWDLAESLDSLGHEVTIFAPEGSKAPEHGHVVYTGKSLNVVNVNWFEEEKKNYEVYKNIITSQNFDIVHGNTWFGFEYLLNHPRIIHTHHGGYSWDSPPKEKSNLVAISKFMKLYSEQYFNQKGYKTMSEYVHNGINLDKYPFNVAMNTNTHNLLYVGRFSKFKQPHVAIEVAKRSNHPIDLVGGTFVDDVQYLKQVESMCNETITKMYKDVSHEFKMKKMQEAKALVFPSQMGEPFGLVALEAMACGTPVIALNDGAISEVIVHGKTGFICNNTDEMVDAVYKVDTINPEDCRKRAEELSRTVMANNYLSLYRRIMNGGEW